MRLHRLIRRHGLGVAGLVYAIAVALAGSAAGLVWRLFVSPLDVERPDRLFVVRAVEDDGDVDDVFSAARYRTLEATDAFARFDAAAAVGYQTVDIETAKGHHRGAVAFASPDIFEVLGRPIRRGRGFLASDFDPDALPVAVISDYFWRAGLDGRSTALGDRININGIYVTVVGIADTGVIGTRLDVGPAAFLPIPAVRTLVPHRPQIWPPARQSLTQEAPVAGAGWLTLVVRLSERDTRVTAERGLNEAVAKQGPTAEVNVAQLVLMPLLEAVPMTSDLELTGSARLLLTVSLALLLLGGATLALAALRDVEARRGELITRLALGATRTQVVASMTGGVVVIGLGAVALAYPLSAAMMTTAAGVLLPGGVELGFLGLTMSAPGALAIAGTGLAGVTVAAGIVALAVLGYTRERTALVARLNESRLIAPRLRGAVVSVLAALAIALFGGAVFAFKAVSRTMAVDLGYQSDRIVYASFDLGPLAYTEGDAREFLRSLLTRIQLSPASWQDRPSCSRSRTWTWRSAQYCRRFAISIHECPPWTSARRKSA